MRRVPFLVAFLAVAVAAALALGPAQPRTGAQAGTPMAGQGFVGAWRLTVSGPGQPPSQSLTTFMADGTLLESDQPVFPAGGGAPVTFTSAGHGVWRQTGPTAAAVTFVELEADAQGHFLDTVTVSARATLGADGNSFGGPYSVTVVDPSGKVLFRGTGTATAARITVQPLASPAAGTPAA